MPHREEREFSITIHLSATFDDEYAGDDDGFAWHERFDREVRPRLVSAVFEALRSNPRYRAVAAPRGRDPGVGIDIDVALEP